MAAPRDVLRIWTGGLLWLLAAAFSTCAAELPVTNRPAAQPFFNLRSRPLEYSGPSDDLTNLTEIRLGWFGPTNLNNPLTGDLWWAANFAIREANEQAVGPDKSSFQSLPFRLVPRWAVDPWGTGVSQLTRMIYDEQVLAVLGSIDSPSTHLAEQVAAKVQLPLISPITTDKSVTLAGVSWMFACAPTDDAIARVLVADVREALQGPSTKLVLLSATDHESRMTVREVLKAFSRQQHPPDFRFEVPPGARAFTNQMAAIEQAHPTAVLIVAGAEDAAWLVKAVRERLPACALFGSHSMGRPRFLELAGRSAEGVRFPLLFVPNPADPATAHFLEQFTRQHQHPPDYTAAFTYDATRLLVESIRRGGPNRARIREALTQLSPWQGIAGPIHFDGTGQNIRTNICMSTVRNGILVTVKR